MLVWLNADKYMQWAELWRDLCWPKLTYEASSVDRELDFSVSS